MHHIKVNKGINYYRIIACSAGKPMEGVVRSLQSVEQN